MKTVSATALSKDTIERFNISYLHRLISSQVSYSPSRGDELDCTNIG
jgi:hypothetical protein